MAITTNTWTNSTAGLTGSPITHSHTATGTPKGIIGFVELQSNQAYVTGATYGGTSMALVAELFRAGGGHTAMYWLGSNANSGTQTFSVSAGSFFGNAYLGVMSLNADANMEIVDSEQISSDSFDDPSATLTLGGRSSFCAIAGAFQDGAADISPLSGWTSRTEQALGGSTNIIYTYDTIGTSNVTAGVTTLSAGYVRAIAIAVAEVAASGGHTKLSGKLGYPLRGKLG